MSPSPLDDSATVDSGSSNSGMLDSPTKQMQRRSSFSVKKRKGRKTLIRDLSLSQQDKARKFDLNGDGELDEAELAMMKYDKDGDGDLTALEIHAIVEDLLRDRGSIHAMRRIIIALSCFVFILSLSNLGTSIASALLVKETTADTATAEMKIVGTQDVMGTQASAETFEALEMDVDTRRARRAMVVQSLLEDPQGEHHHRFLAKGKIKCTGQKKCDGDISFDVNVMRQSDVESIKTKCDQGRIVNVKRSFPGGSKDSKGLCNSGTSITIKQKKMTEKYIKGPRKDKKKPGFQMNVRSNGVDTNFDCDGKDCYLSGDNLLNGPGGPCNLNHGSDDCKPDLVCIQSKNDVTSGTCTAAFWDEASWYVDWDNNQCVQNCEGAPNCGGLAGKWDEQFVSYTLCCDTFFSYVAGGYSKCVPDLDWHLGLGRDCTDNPNICKGKFQCKSSKDSDRSYCA